MNRVTMKWFASAIPAIILFAATPAFAAQTLVLKLDGVSGESALKGHEKEIDILSWNWGVETNVSAHVSSGAGTGSSKIYDLTLTKMVDAASPMLYQNAYQGKVLKDAVLVVANVGGRRETPYITIRMKNVVISSVKTTQANSSDRPTEQITLSFSSAEYTYTPMKADGSAASSISFTIDSRGR